jgi:hypothetical protein
MCSSQCTKNCCGLEVVRVVFTRNRTTTFKVEFDFSRCPLYDSTTRVLHEPLVWSQYAFLFFFIVLSLLSFHI